MRPRFKNLNSTTIRGLTIDAKEIVARLEAAHALRERAGHDTESLVSSNLESARVLADLLGATINLYRKEES